ncbi:MAG: DUF1178 family protein, partial [Tabrizicola sp.]|nr:DUF1178 family protein [Tabrizicola sp.]
MIRYSLKCTAGHQFESWFQNADAFGALKAAGRLTCAICGDAGVEKDLMAPGVQSGGAATRVPAREAVPHNRPDLSLPESEIERAVAAWRKHVESHSEYVGVQFAREVRRIHNGEAP